MGGLAGDDADNTDDDNGNMTVDFGFFHPAPAIDIEKHTNGYDADTGTGPELNAGGAVVWTYVVTNIGNESLVNIVLSDDKEGAVSCPKTTLAIGESMTCTKTGTAHVGNYANIATVTGKGQSTNTPVTDTDPSHYHVKAPSPQLTGAITGKVTEVDQNGHNPRPIPGVVLVLFDKSGHEVARTTTDSNGNYRFEALPGEYYIQEWQPAGYYNVSEDEGGADNDVNNRLLDTIGVIVSANETDIQNDFVESKKPSKSGCGCPLHQCNLCQVAHTKTVNDTSATLKWVNYDSEVAFRIYVNGVFVRTLDKDVTEYTLDNLSANTDYIVKIVADNGKGRTATQTISFKTKLGYGWLPAIYHIMN